MSTGLLYPWTTPLPTPPGVGTALGAGELPYAGQIAAQLPGAAPTITGSIYGSGAATTGSELAGAAATGGRLGGLLGRAGGFATNPITAIPTAAYIGASLLEPLDDPNIPTPKTPQELVAHIDKYQQLAAENPDTWWGKGIDQKIAASPAGQIVEQARRAGVDPTPLLQPLLDAKRAGGDEAAIAKAAEPALTAIAQLPTPEQRAAQAEQAKQQQYAQDQQRISDQNFAITLQAQAAQYFQPYIQNILQGGQAQAEGLRALASQVPAGFRGVYEAQANMAAANAQSLAGAYAAQSVLGTQQYYAGIAAQGQQAQTDMAYKQALTQEAIARAQLAQAQAAGGGASGGGQSFDQFLQSQGVGG